MSRGSNAVMQETYSNDNTPPPPTTTTHLEQLQNNAVNKYHTQRKYVFSLQAVSLQELHNRISEVLTEKRGGE